MFNKTRNIKLVELGHKDYVAYMDFIRQSNYKMRKANKRSAIDLLSRPMELAINSWIDKAGLLKSERVIVYELLKLNKYEKAVRELDFVMEMDGELWLGEIKTSSSAKSINKASMQLRRSQELLARIGLQTKLLIIHVDMNKDPEIEFSDFNEDFRKMEFSLLNKKRDDLFFLRLNPDDIFEFGVNNNIIHNNGLLEDARNEALRNMSNREQRRELKENNVPVEEWPEHLKPKGRLEDQNDYIQTFEVESAPNLMQQKLMQALGLAVA
jgi:hypothetical protein